MRKGVLFLFAVLLLVPGVTAFEDTFQWYPLGEADTTFQWWTINNATYDIAHVENNVGYNRVLNIYAHVHVGVAAIKNSIAGNILPLNSNYIAFNVIDASSVGNYVNCKTYVNLTDVNNNLIARTYITTLGESVSNSLYEYSRDSGTTAISLFVNGVSRGIIASSSPSITYIEFFAVAQTTGSPSCSSNLIIDDVTTTGYLTGTGVETPYHKVTEATLKPTYTSYLLKSFPTVDYTGSQFDSVWKYTIDGTPTTINTTRIKNATASTPFVGLNTYNRSRDLTVNDTRYGMYWNYLMKNNVSVSSDYFFLALIGNSASITFTDNPITIGMSEPITYNTDTADFATYNYFVKVYGASGELFSQTLSSQTGTATWDTTGDSAGTVYAVISRTHKSTGAYDEIAYVVGSLSSNLMIKGYTYDAEDGVHGNVSINFSQGLIWYNTTSNATTGYYQLQELLVDVPIRVNASHSPYHHENFTFTPLVPKVYNINLYLVNNTPNKTRNAVGGLVYDYPYHQPVIGAEVHVKLISNHTHTTTNICNIYNNGSWCNLTSAIPNELIFIKDTKNATISNKTKLYRSRAIGGNITFLGDYVIHTFTNNNTFTPVENITVEYLVVAGGGTGFKDYGNPFAGGGGAGGYLNGTTNVTNTSYNIVVGIAGTHGNNNSNVIHSSNSSFNSIEAVGGGHGASSYIYDEPAQNGGSGGGANGWDTSGGLGIPGQGFDGGGVGIGGGGGGGAFSAGNPGTWGMDFRYGGFGGDGKLSNISGTLLCYSGGGGGSGTYSYILEMYRDGRPGCYGVDKSGYGMGGTSSVLSSTDGTQGIVIIRYLANITEDYEVSLLPLGGVITNLVNTTENINLTQLDVLSELFINKNNTCNAECVFYVNIDVTYTHYDPLITIISSNTGWYIFSNVSNLTSYYVNASKSGYKSSIIYNTTTYSNYTDQNILMYKYYTLTLTAKDAATLATIQSFMVFFNSSTYNTTTALVTVPNIIYGLYSYEISKEGYNAYVGSILIDDDKVVSALLTIPTVSQPSTLFKTLPHNVRFRVQDWQGNVKSGVFVQVQGWNTTVGSMATLSQLLGLDFAGTPINNQSMNGTTDSTGSINFMMIDTIYYTLQFSGSGINVNWTLYPKEDFYLVLVGTTDPNAACPNIAFNLTNTVFNGTHNSLGLIYNDPAGTTSLINFYVKDVNGNYLNNTHVHNTSSWSPTFYVNSSKNQVYYWGFNATAGTCTGTIGATNVITFKGTGRWLTLGDMPDIYYQWISIAGIVFIAGLFSIRNVRFAAVVVPFTALFFSVIGWFGINAIILAVCLVLGVIVYVRMSEVKVNY